MEHPCCGGNYCYQCVCGCLRCFGWVASVRACDPAAVTGRVCQDSSLPVAGAFVNSFSPGHHYIDELGTSSVLSSPHFNTGCPRLSDTLHDAPVVAVHALFHKRMSTNSIP